MSPLICEVVEDMILLYREGELQEETRQEIDEHLRGCPKCREKIKYSENITVLLNEIEPQVDMNQAKKAVKKLRQRLWLNVAFAFLILTFTVNYYYSGFTFSLVTQISTDHTEIGENYYLGYGLHWRGLLKPKLVDVRLRNKDGSIIDQNHEQLEVTPLIDVLGRTGTSNEADFLEASARGIVEYVPVEDAKIKDFNTLVLRVNLKDEDYENTVESMVLSYRILGIPKRQAIEYRGVFWTPK